MKKQYIFIILIMIILYMLYLIINYKYKEYKINTQIEFIAILNQDIKQGIKKAENIIKYKTTKAYKNKIIKSQQQKKNKWEKVFYLTSEKSYNKYTKEIIEEAIDIEIKTEKENIIDSMDNYEKWIYFLFNKDIR